MTRGIGESPSRTSTGRTDPAGSVYLAFPDGVLHYVCTECTALCCKGFGMGGNVDREMGRLLEIYPAWQSHAILRQGTVVELTTPPTGCHFLRDDERCGIEVEHGRALKPGVCLQFPFNRLGRIGHTVTVRPHFLCPLRLVLPARPGDVEGTHGRILETLEETRLVDSGFENRVAPFRLGRRERAPRVAAREEAFCAACAAGIGRRTFRETLDEHVEGVPRGRRPGGAARIDRSNGLPAFVDRALAVWGVEPVGRSNGSDAIDDLLHAVAPSLRLDFLHLGEPGITRALALGEEVVRSRWTLARRPPTPQALYAAIESVAPILALLAREGEPVRLPSLRSRKLAATWDPAMTIAVVGVHRRIELGSSILDALEASFGVGMSTTDRTTAMVELGRRAEVAASGSRR